MSSMIDGLKSSYVGGMRSELAVHVETVKPSKLSRSRAHPYRINHDRPRVQKETFEYQVINDLAAGDGTGFGNWMQ